MMLSSHETCWVAIGIPSLCTVDVGLQMSPCTFVAFMWMLGVRGPVLRFAWQALYPSATSPQQPLFLMSVLQSESVVLSILSLSPGKQSLGVPVYPCGATLVWLLLPCLWHLSLEFLLPLPQLAFVSQENDSSRLFCLVSKTS